MMSLLIAYICGALTIYSWIIIARALASWLAPHPRNVLHRLLVDSTEPVLAPLRALVPPQRTANVDLSPLVAVLIIHVVKIILWATLG